MRRGGARLNSALPPLILTLVMGCGTRGGPDPTYRPTESVLEAVSLLRLHVDDDTYRFPPARDFTGKNVYRAVLERLDVLGIRPLHSEGIHESEWVLIDCNTFVIHIFTPSRREFYDLERLWADAEVMIIPERKGSLSDA